ncbi:class I SAM-dependent methyltransferase [candidate division KSB1 bacterium]|nr:class I SAM-dependent methyltransferase [candidate division KSB1 bacterium]
MKLLRLPNDSQVVDIACGKGEFLIRLAEAFGARGMGIDISPFHIADAKKKLEVRAPNAGITFTQMNGADFKPDFRIAWIWRHVSVPVGSLADR